MNISLKQLKAFVILAQTGSFTQSAQQLFISQSALSGLIKELENHLNLKLFDRTTRQLSLSKTGEILLPQAKRILNEYHIFQQEIHTLTHLEKGQVRLAVSQQFATSAMPSIIAKFSQQFPNIYISMLDCSVEEVIFHVKNGDVDLGIGAEREFGDDIKAEFLFQSPFYVVLPPNHTLCQKNKICWQDLQNEHFIMLKGPFTQRLLNEIPDKFAKNLQKPAYQVNFLSTALGLTQENLGITLCLSYANHWVEQHGLVMKILQQPKIQRRFFLYYRKNRALSPATQAFCQLIKKTLN